MSVIIPTVAMESGQPDMIIQGCSTGRLSMAEPNESAKPKSSKKLYEREDLMAYDSESEHWQKQLARRYAHHGEMVGVLNNVEVVPEATYQNFDMKITPYTAQLMDQNDPNCPIRLQYMPTNKELESIQREETMHNELGEEEDTIPGTSVVHRYPRRVLFLTTTQCASFCRYCTRARIVSHGGEAAITKKHLDASIDYIAGNKDIEDVLLSGGDPFILPDNKLDEILGRIRAEAPHVRFLRIGSRLPVQMPTRITPELCEILERHNVNMVNIHVNHPKEVTPLLASRMKMLRKAGVMIGNQAVMLKGVNDSIEVMTELCLRMVEMGVRPYYVYSNDPVAQAAHFTVSLKEMLNINEGMRGFLSGPAMPTFVVDGVGGLGKMPVQKEYVSFDKNGGIFAQNFEGKTARMPHLE
ncbi:hypothetical protein Pori4_00199 [Pseudomonas phage vB_PpuM-Pori-4]